MILIWSVVGGQHNLHTILYFLVLWKVKLQQLTSAMMVYLIILSITMHLFF